MDYNDLLNIMDQAMTSENGIALQFDSKREAELWQGKAYRVRADERTKVRRATDPLQPLPDPLTPYDCLQFRLADTEVRIIPKPELEPKRRVDNKPIPPVRYLTSCDLSEMPAWPRKFKP
jgi:hypothetical protein